MKMEILDDDVQIVDDSELKIKCIAGGNLISHPALFGNNGELVSVSSRMFSEKFLILQSITSNIFFQSCVFNLEELYQALQCHNRRVD